MAELTGRPDYRRTLGLCTVPGLAVAVVGIFIAPLLIVVGLIGALAGPLIYYLVLRSQASSAAKDQVMHAVGGGARLGLPALTAASGRRRLLPRTSSGWWPPTASRARSAICPG